ncbi:hypothetical protein QYE76_029829 [Lolium multiflorum]|uniref:Retrotransposon gag domain-containing protein n=1 Tax=Lolium multiflorum TaxID=4521 RepID=A0AAD8VI92_LOLMU|nr:hypothetical protein QYE76_029829 [Lolium multiflorum]
MGRRNQHPRQHAHLETGTGSVRRNNAEVGIKTASRASSEPRTRPEPRRSQGRDPEPRRSRNEEYAPSHAGAGTTEATTTKRKGHRPEPAEGATPRVRGRKITLRPPRRSPSPPPSGGGGGGGGGRRSRSRSKSPGGAPRDARDRLNEYRSDYIGPRCFGQMIREEPKPKSLNLKLPGNLKHYDGSERPDTWIEDYYNAVTFAGGTPNIACRMLQLYLIGPARVWLSDLEENTIFCWLDLKKAFENHFRGTYKRPATTSDLQACIQKKAWGLLRHKLTCLVNANKLTLDEMINIAAIIAADDAQAEILRLRYPPPTEKTVITASATTTSGRTPRRPEGRRIRHGSHDVPTRRSRAEEARTRRRSEAEPQRGDEVTAADPAPPNVRRIRGYAVHGPSGSGYGQVYPHKSQRKWVNDRRMTRRRDTSEPGSTAHAAKEARARTRTKRRTVPRPWTRMTLRRNPRRVPQQTSPTPLAKRVSELTTPSSEPQHPREKSALRILNATIPAVPHMSSGRRKPVPLTGRIIRPSSPKSATLGCESRIDGYDFSKCLMDGGASLNIMYLETLEKMNLTKDQLKHSTTEFHGVVPGKKANSLGSIKLPVAFGDVNNYREEMITFEVVPFKSSYHVIFGRPTYHKFHARACYIYNKLKIPGPNGWITVSGDYKKARDCEEGEAAFAESVISERSCKATEPRWIRLRCETTKKQISNRRPRSRPR